MLIHHALTIGLVALSYTTGQHRIGILVLMCHDHSDIFLEAAKLWKYVKLEPLSNLTFVGLMVSWIYSRLYLYPVYVVSSCFLERWGSGYAMPWDSVLIFWLASLELLHVNWFYLILRVAERAVLHEIDDVREDVDSDGDGEEKEEEEEGSG